MYGFARASVPAGPLSPPRSFPRAKCMLPCAMHVPCMWSTMRVIHHAWSSKIPQDSLRFLEIPLSDLYAEPSGGPGPLAPLCFLFFVLPSRPLPLTPPGRVVNGRSKTLRLARCGPRASALGVRRYPAQFTGNPCVCGAWLPKRVTSYELPLRCTSTGPPNLTF